MSADALIAHFEQEKSRALGNARRRDAGLYYTPAHLAARVVEIALREGGIAAGRVLDPCAGAGAFLVAAARAGLRDLHGFDLDPEALRVARHALRLCGAKARLMQLYWPSGSRWCEYAIGTEPRLGALLERGRVDRRGGRSDDWEPAQAADGAVGRDVVGVDERVAPRLEGEKVGHGGVAFRRGGVRWRPAAP